MNENPVEVVVYIPTSLRSLTNGLARVTVVARDIATVIDALDTRFDGMRDRLCENGAVRHYVNVYINGEEIRSLQGERTPLRPGDEVAFVPMLMGGAPLSFHQARK